MNDFTRLIFENKVLFMILSSILFFITAWLIIILIRYFFDISKETLGYSFLVTITMVITLVLAVFVNTEISDIHEKPITIKIDSIKIHNSYSTIRSNDKIYKVKNSIYAHISEDNTITIANYGEYYKLVN